MGGEWGVFQNHHSHEMEEEELDGPSFDKNLPTTCLVSHHTLLSHPHPHHPYTDSGPRMLFTTKMYNVCEWRQQQGVVWLGTPLVVGVLIGDEEIWLRGRGIEEVKLSDSPGGGHTIEL